MNRPVLIAGCVGFALLVGATSIVLAETLLATSTTAMAITGDVEMDDFSMVFADGTRLDFDELVGDSFVVDGETVNASVYSVAALSMWSVLRTIVGNTSLPRPMVAELTSLTSSRICRRKSPR